MKRRTVLRGLALSAGVPLLGPITGRLLPEALGAANAGRKRFVLITHGGGLLEGSTTCPARNERDFDLTPVLSPLAPFKDQLLVLSKFFVPFDKRQHGNQYAALSMARSANQIYGDWIGRPAGGISFDRFLAGRIGASDPFPSIAQAVEENVGDAPCLSADGPGQEFPAVSDPVRAYSLYFGHAAAAQDPAAARRLLAEDRSVLDALREDIVRLEGRLAGAERVKLEQYLESLRALERQLSKLGAARARCSPSDAPAPRALRLHPDLVDAHLDVMFAAHECGLTRVSHMSIHGFGSPHIPYGWLGDTQGYHNCHHTNNRPMIDKIATYVMSTVARFAGRLAASPEAGGSMLDQSLVLFLNTCGGKHHDGHDSYAAITLGRAGGALQTGRQLRYDTGTHALSDAYVAFAQALGVPLKSFGEPSVCKGPLPGLA